jgi:hypothetical protein
MPFRQLEVLSAYTKWGALILLSYKLSSVTLKYSQVKRTAHIRHQCRKATVLSCNRCLLNTRVEKIEKYFNIEYNFDHQISKSKCWYRNNCLHILKRAVTSVFMLFTKQLTKWQVDEM